MLLMESTDAQEPSFSQPGIVRVPPQIWMSQLPKESHTWDYLRGNILEHFPTGSWCILFSFRECSLSQTMGPLPPRPEGSGMEFLPVLSCPFHGWLRGLRAPLPAKKENKLVSKTDILEGNHSDGAGKGSEPDGTIHLLFHFFSQDFLAFFLSFSHLSSGFSLFSWSEIHFFLLHL